MLGVGIILAKFSIDFYRNRKSSDSYLKYAIYSGISFLIYNGALFSVQRIPKFVTLSLFLFSLLVFSMIGVNDSLKSLRSVTEKKLRTTGNIFLIIFSVHGLYAFILASAFLKGYNFNFLLPGIMIFDLFIFLPFVLIRKLYDHYLLLALLVISLSINTFLFLMIQNTASQI